MSYQNPPDICTVCKKEAEFKFIQDYKNERGEWSLYECPECQVQFWLPFKSPEYKIEFISKDIFDAPTYHKHFLNFVKNFPKNIKILDIGCGRGELIARLQNLGYTNTFGIDIDENVINFAKKQYGLKNFYAISAEKFLAEIKSNPQKFDIISFFELIEHLDNPLKFIQDLSSSLKDKGFVVLSTPSRERILSRTLYGDHPPSHLTRWNEEAISNLFGRFNFKIIKVIYVDQFKWSLGALTEKIRFGLIQKIQNLTTKGKENGIPPKETFITKLIHVGAYLKDYLICGLPAVILFLIGKLTNRKNGDMLFWLKREK